MSDQPPIVPAPQPVTTEQFKLQIQSVVTSALMIGGAAFFGKYVSQGAIASFSTELAPVLISGVIALGSLVWKLLPMNASKKIALAKETGLVSRIVTTDAIANSPKFAADPAVVTYQQALATNPPPVVVPK